MVLSEADATHIRPSPPLPKVGAGRLRDESFSAHISQPADTTACHNTSTTASRDADSPATPSPAQFHPLGEQRLSTVLTRSQRTCLKLWKPKPLGAAVKGWRDDRLFEK